MSGRHEDWLAYAEDDLKFARVGLREGFYSQVCFHAQQAIEKSLKGFLVFQGRSYPKSHGLIELARAAPELDLKKWQSSLAEIEGYYVPIRYPDAAVGMKSSGSPNKEEAERSLLAADAVFQEVAARLKSKSCRKKF